MFDHMDSVMPALAKKKTPWKDDLFSAVKLARQKLSNTMLKWRQRWACCSFLHISSILFRSCDSVESGTREWILILRTRHPILPNTQRPYWFSCTMNSVPNIDLCWSISTKAYRAAIPSPPQWLQNPVNHPLIHMNRSSDDQEYLTPHNVAETTPGQSDHSARLLTAARLYFNSPPEALIIWGQINPNFNDYHSNPMEISSTFWLPEITDWWSQ